MNGKALWLIGLGWALAACASDGDGGTGTGSDMLPKRGEMASDPTIVSATARCSSCGSEICPGGEPSNAYVSVRVDASDPMGAANLGTCAATVGDVTDQDGFGDGNEACRLYFKMTCTAGEAHVVGLTVSNDTGGVTTASVKLTVAD